MDARAGPGAGVFVYRLQTSKISSPEETPSRFRGRLSLHLCESAVEGIPAAPECGSTGPRGGAVPNQLLRIAVLAGATLAGCGSLYAQGVPGITTKEILIGPCSALEGPSRARDRTDQRRRSVYPFDQSGRRSRRPPAAAARLRRQLRSSKNGSLL